jgi:cytochrome P450
VEKRARAEVLSVIGKGGIPTADDISDQKTPYLAAVLKESLRMQPPVHNLLTRRAGTFTLRLCGCL